MSPFLILVVGTLLVLGAYLFWIFAGARSTRCTSTGGFSSRFGEWFKKSKLDATKSIQGILALAMVVTVGIVAHAIVVGVFAFVNGDNFVVRSFSPKKFDGSASNEPENWQSTIQSKQEEEGLRNGWSVIRFENVTHEYDPRGDTIQPVTLCTAGMEGWLYDYNVDVPEEQSKIGVYTTADEAARKAWVSLTRYSAGTNAWGQLHNHGDLLYVERRAKEETYQEHIITFLQKPQSRSSAMASCFVYRGEKGEGAARGAVVDFGTIWTHPPELPQHRLVVDVYIVATQPDGMPLPSETLAQHPMMRVLGSEAKPDVRPMTRYKRSDRIKAKDKNPELAVRVAAPCRLYANIIVRDIVPLITVK